VNVDGALQDDGIVSQGRANEFRTPEGASGLANQGIDQAKLVDDDPESRKGSSPYREESRKK